MTDPRPARPLSARPLPVRDALRALGGSPFRLALLAAAAILMAMALPFLGVRIDIGLGTTRGSLDGAEAAGWVAWVALFAFAGAAASRRAAALRPYANLIDVAAIASGVAMPAAAWFFNPLAGQLDQASRLMRGFARPGAAVPDMASFHPHVGMVFPLVAIGLLIAARRREGAAGTPGD